MIAKLLMLLALHFEPVWVCQDCYDFWDTRYERCHTFPLPCYPGDAECCNDEAARCEECCSWEANGQASCCLISCHRRPARHACLDDAAAKETYCLLECGALEDDCDPEALKIP